MRIARQALFPGLAPALLLFAGCAAPPPGLAPKTAEPPQVDPSSNAASRASQRTAENVVVEPASSPAANRGETRSAPAPTEAASPIPANMSLSDEPIYFPGG